MKLLAKYFPVLLLALLVFAALSATGIHRNQTVVHVLGDSIAMESIGWSKQARRILWSKYRIRTIARINAETTNFTIENLDTWLAAMKEKPDIIIWNNGLHDVVRQPMQHPDQDRILNTPPEAYERNLHTIARRLKPQAPIVVFLTTTPVINGTLNMWNEEIDRYNEIAHWVMKEENIPVIDLNGFCRTALDQDDFFDGVHWKRSAARRQARFIFEELEKTYLP